MNCERFNLIPQIILSYFGHAGLWQHLNTVDTRAKISNGFDSLDAFGK
jgi:hypothetical protein